MPHPAHRPVLPAMRALLLTFTVLTVLGSVALVVFADRTADLFAWTITPPVTAAFLGSGYAAGTLLAVLSLRARAWADARIAVVTVLVFTTLTLLATLRHLDRFHLAAGGPVGRAAAWFWLAVYVVVPVAMAVLLHAQRRAPGTDPAPGRPMPGPLSLLLAAQGVLLLAVGTVLYLAPGSAAALWPWPLTPLTARAVASWLVAFGVAALLAVRERDLDRLRIPAATYAALGILQLVTVARYADQLDWSAPVAWAYLAVLATVVAAGGAGLRPGRTVPAARPRERQAVAVRS